MLIAPADIKGKVIFEWQAKSGPTNQTDKKLLYIEESLIGDEKTSFSFARDLIWKMPISGYSRLNNLEPPRYPRFIIYSAERVFTEIKPEVFSKMTEEVLRTNNQPLKKFVNILKNHGFQNEKHENSEKNLFSVWYKANDSKDKNVEVTLDARTSGWLTQINENVKLKITDDTFEVKNTGKTTQKDKTAGFYYLNEFENIFLPYDDSKDASDDSEMAKDFETITTKVKRRAELNGRMSKDYIFVPSSNLNRKQIRIKEIQNRKVKSFMAFFGCTKRSQSKVDTLGECFRAIQRHNKDQEVGKKFIIEIPTGQQVNETPFDCLPVDYILTKAASMRILCSEQIGKSTRMITEITNTPCEDFTQTLYTILNTFDINKGPSGNTKIVAFPHELIDNIIKQLKEDQKNSETS